MTKKQLEEINSLMQDVHYLKSIIDMLETMYSFETEDVTQEIAMSKIVKTDCAISKMFNIANSITSDLAMIDDANVYYKIHDLLNRIYAEKKEKFESIVIEKEAKCENL